MVAGMHGPLPRVIETAALIVHDNGFGGLAGFNLAEESLEHLHAHGRPAGVAGGVAGAIDALLGKRRIAGVASKRRVVLGRTQSNSLAIANDARIADSVMKRTFFFVECRHDVANQED